MWDKARKILYRGGEILELLMAAAVVAGILVAMITLVPAGALLGTPDDGGGISGVSGCRV